MSPDEPGGSSDARLERALAGLVASGGLDVAQADRVREAYQQQTSAPAAAPDASAAGRIPEVLGYLGGAFVVAAGLLVLGWSWSDFSYPTRLVIAWAAALATLGAGLAIAVAASGGTRTLRTPEQAARRRLVGVLLVAGTYISSGALALVLDHSGVDRVFPWASVLAVVLGAIAVRLAPGVIPTGGLFVASLMSVLTLSDLPGDLPQLTWTLVFLGLGLLWVVLGPWFTRTVDTARALGLGTLVVTAWAAAAYRVYEPGPFDPEAVSGRWGDDVVGPLGLAVLVALAVVGVTIYLRGGSWTWMAAGTVAAVGVVVEVTGDAFGPAVAALVAGMVLLAASGLLVLRRGRGSGPAAVSDPGP